MTRTLCLSLALLANGFRGTEAHGSMIMPPSRNSVDAELPAWSHGKFPETGTIEPYLLQTIASGIKPLPSYRLDCTRPLSHGWPEQVHVQVCQRDR